MLALVWIIGIIILIVFFYLVFVLPAKRHENRKENHINNLMKLHSNMKVEDVQTIMGKGLYIDWYKAYKLKEKYNKNLKRGYFTENRDISNNPLYRVRLEKNEVALYYGETRHEYTTNGYRGTDTYYYFAIIIFFKDGIIDRIEDHNKNILFEF